MHGQLDSHTFTEIYSYIVPRVTVPSRNSKRTNVTVEEKKQRMNAKIHKHKGGSFGKNAPNTSHFLADGTSQETLNYILVGSSSK